MSGDGQQQLQTAVYNAAVAALATAGTGGTQMPVYDHVPQDSGFNYVSIGDPVVGEFDTTTEIGQEHRITLHVFTRDSRGKKAAYVIQKLLYDALHAQSLSLGAGAALVFIQQEFSTVTLDPDGLTYHGVQRFHAVTTEA